MILVVITLAMKILEEFKKFLMRGNVLDLATAVIVGGAFGKIVSSLVDDILMPIIGLLMGGLDFSGLAVTIGDATVKYGMFIQNIVNFVIIAGVIFLLLKASNRMIELAAKKQEKKEGKPKKSDEVLLLEEIRDLLKKRN